MAINDQFTIFLRQIQTPLLHDFVKTFGVRVQRKVIDSDLSFEWILEYKRSPTSIWTSHVTGYSPAVMAQQAYVEFCKQRIKGA